MTDEYQPKSEFLRAVAADEIPLFGSAFADSNFRRLLAMTTDSERSNRDWATLLISQQSMDTDEIRDILRKAALDEDEAVRAEAILGLAQRDPKGALPLIRSALKAGRVMAPVFEAAAIAADRSLIHDLRKFLEPSGDAYVDQLAAEALTACEKRRS